MTWSTLGKPAQFYEIKYGVEKETLDRSLETDRMGVIFQNIDTSRRWYFQITPMFGTERDKSHGSPSEIYDWMAPLDPNQ
jgi:hypothetical protein